jgi:hypothetical protein
LNFEEILMISILDGKIVIVFNRREREREKHPPLEKQHNRAKSYQY